MCFNLYHAKEVQLFFGLGIYSGIFAIYLQSASKDSRTTTMVFYALCLLYILSTASVVSDLLQVILVNIDSLGISNNSICKNIISLLAMLMHLTTLPVQLQNDLQSVLFRIVVIQQTVNGCCDFIAQCTLVRINHSSCTYHLFYSPKSSKIYHCWIVWGKNIWVMIIPSFLANAYIGQWIYLCLISQFQFSIVSSYLASSNWCNSRRWRWVNCSLGGPHWL